MDREPTITVNELAVRWSCSRRAIYDLLDIGKLATTRERGPYSHRDRIRLSDIETREQGEDYCLSAEQIDDALAWHEAGRPE